MDTKRVLVAFALFSLTSGTVLAQQGMDASSLSRTNGSAASAIQFSKAPSRLGVFYYAHEKETFGTSMLVGGLVMALIDNAIHSTPELKRLSLSERERLAPLANVGAAHASLLQQTQKLTAQGAIVDVKYGMLQDMSAVIIKAEVRFSGADKKTPPIALVYQSNVHEVQAKTPEQAAELMADIEQNSAGMSKREHRKAIADATSPQWGWPQIYRLHADYWAAGNAEQLHAALGEGVHDIASMLARVVDPGTGGWIDVGNVISENGPRRIRKERDYMIVSKARDDAPHFLQANSFLN